MCLVLLVQPAWPRSYMRRACFAQGPGEKSLSREVENPLLLSRLRTWRRMGRFVPVGQGQVLGSGRAEKVGTDWNKARPRQDQELQVIVFSGLHV